MVILLRVGDGGCRGGGRGRPRSLDLPPRCASLGAVMRADSGGGDKWGALFWVPEQCRQGHALTPTLSQRERGLQRRPTRTPCPPPGRCALSRARETGPHPRRCALPEGEGVAAAAAGVRVPSPRAL